MTKHQDARFDDTRVIDSSGNVFVDLGFDPAEAYVMALRVELMMKLRERLESEGLTEKEAAHLLGVTQPRVSSLFKGTWRDFNVDTLLAQRAGLHPRMQF
jgi:predicted XRE-type DNA-binding protein